ncbi:MAG: sigma-70 family RNA polymerase sigma factor [Clostridia bacterium]|nr:sigma-70 family RNA polymerase sigma factor [Clostridia bacterium]
MKKSSLLEKEGPITIEDLKKNFKENDFTTMKSKFNLKKANEDEMFLYGRAKTIFQQSWNDKMGELTGLSSLINFSDDSPLVSLEKTDETLVSGIVMELREDEEALERIFDSYCRITEERCVEEIAKYAEETGKDPDEMTEEELETIFNGVVDEFLAKMMSLFLQTQSVPELVELQKSMAAHEDFSETVVQNFSKIDFDRKWTHSRSEAGAALSLDGLIEAFQDAIPVEPLDNATEEVEVIDVERKVLENLKETDKEIYLMKKYGYSQNEIAEKLGFKSASAVSKRLANIKQIFIEQML